MRSRLGLSELPLPAHYDPAKVGQVWKTPYQERAGEALLWARQHQVEAADLSPIKISLIGVDLQNTFCTPGFELFVGGRSGTGAVDDSRRLAEWIYRNLANITSITMTMDTHHAMQIFHPLFLIDANGEHPSPLTQVTVEDVEAGRWKFNPEIAPALGVSPQYGQDILTYYTNRLASAGKYDLTIWPYHAMLGGIGHALVSAIEEAVFFHTIARASQPDFNIKGEYTFTENYSAIGPEVTTGPHGESLGRKNEHFLQKIQHSDLVVIAGQAKSHCVAWTIQDLLDDLQRDHQDLVRKIYLLEDCTSSVVVPGIIDFTEPADAAFRKFEQAGMHRVRSTDPIASWPGIQEIASK